VAYCPYEQTVSEEDNKTEYWSTKKMEEVLVEGMCHPAGGFGTHNTIDLMLKMGVEQKAIRDARRMGCCRLNEFRSRIGLKRYANFEEMKVRNRRWYCSEEEYELAVEEAENDIGILEHYYKDINNVELAVGYMCEEATNSGLGFSETLGLGIIADAFSSVRQDKYYQTRFTPGVYTQWGYDHAKGTCLQDLVNRHLNLPYIDRSTSLVRLPQDWRVKHEKLKEKSRLEQAGLMLMAVTGPLIAKLFNRTITDEEIGTLYEALHKMSPDQQELIVEVGLRKKKIAKDKKDKFTKIRLSLESVPLDGYEATGKGALSEEEREQRRQQNEVNSAIELLDEMEAADQRSTENGAELMSEAKTTFLTYPIAGTARRNTLSILKMLKDLSEKVVLKCPELAQYAGGEAPTEPALEEGAPDAVAANESMAHVSVTELDFEAGTISEDQATEGSAQWGLLNGCAGRA